MERYNSPLREYTDMIGDYDAVVAQMMNPFMGERRTDNRTPKLKGEALAQAKGLHKWQLEDGSIVYARNAGEAIRRAKKRGLWKDGCSVKLIEL